MVSSTSCFASSPLAPSVLLRDALTEALRAVASACASWPCAWRRLASSGAGSILNRMSPALTSVPSLYTRCRTTPVTRARTCAVSVAARRPGELRTTGTSVARAVSTPTSGGGGGGGAEWLHAPSASASTHAPAPRHGRFIIGISRALQGSIAKYDGISHAVP